jgi:hypothetical protein
MTHARGKGLSRVQNPYPNPYPHLPYPQPLGFLKPLIIPTFRAGRLLYGLRSPVTSERVLLEHSVSPTIASTTPRSMCLSQVNPSSRCWKITSFETLHTASHSYRITSQTQEVRSLMCESLWKLQCSFSTMLASTHVCFASNLLHGSSTAQAC